MILFGNFLAFYKGVIPNPKMILMSFGKFFPKFFEKKNPKCIERGSFPRFKIKSLVF